MIFPLVQLLFDLCQTNLSSLEYQLSKAKKQKRLDFMNQDWAEGGSHHFKEIRPLPKPTVSILEIPAPVKVTRCRHFKSGPFYVLCSDFPKDAPWMEYAGNRHQVLSIHGPRVQVDKPIQASTSTITVMALIPTGDPKQMQDLATLYWEKFWKANPEVDIPAVENILRTSPAVPKLCSQITLEELRHATRSISPNKARGPDGWSNYELKTMPEDLEAKLLELLNSFTETASWPQPLLDSTVAMLAKTPNTVTLSQTRPITVLSTVYRLWSKIMARKFLLNALPWFPKEIQGNRPGASAKWIGTYLQALAEHALISDRPFHVVSFDLVKAYNLLQRDVLRLCNKQFGMPADAWNTYEKFLFSVRRHFRLLGDISQGVLSTTGCPEGDALAVFQMTQINWLATLHLEHEQRCTRDTVFLNYVDNWFLHSYFHNALEASALSIVGLADVAGYKIGHDKTWVSSASSTTRSILRSWELSGSRPCTSKLELGMLLRFTKSPAVAAVFPRWEDGLARISSMVHKEWSVERKAQVVVRGVMPMIFAGCATVHVSLSTFRTIRAKMNTAVLGRWTSSSHLLSPLFASNTAYEPFIYVLRTRLASLRMCILSFGGLQIQESWNWVRLLDLSKSQHKMYGPVALFIWSCQILKWEVLEDFHVQVRPGIVLHLLSTPKKMWHVFMEQAWVDYVFHHFMQKQGVSFGEIHVSLRTWKSLLRKYKSLPPMSLKFRTFGIMSALAMARSKGLDEYHCATCGQVASGTKHLALQCPGLADLRNAQNSNVKWLPRTSPNAQDPRDPLLLLPFQPFCARTPGGPFPRKNLLFHRRECEPFKLAEHQT